MYTWNTNTFVCLYISICEHIHINLDIYIHKYTCIYVYVYMYIYTYTHKYVYVNVRIHKYTCLCINIYTYMYKYTIYTNIYINAHIYTECMYVHIRKWGYTHIYIYTYIHISTYMRITYIWTVQIPFTGTVHIVRASKPCHLPRTAHSTGTIQITSGREIAFNTEWQTCIGIHMRVWIFVCIYR
jgi:hypothetical protein